MKKRVLAALLTVAMGMSLFSGCGNTNDGSDTEADAGNKAESSDGAGSEDGGIGGTISFWTTGDKSNPDDFTYVWMEENIKLFEEKYPECTVEATFTTSGADYLTKITTEVAAGNAPDVFQTDLTGRLQPFVDGGKILSIDHMLETYPETKAIMNDKALQLATFDGTAYAVPLLASGEVVFYNKEIFEQCGAEVPKTYDEFLEVVDKLRENDVTPCIMGIADPWPGTIPYMMIFDRLNGTELYEDVILNKKADFANEAFIQAGEKLKELVEHEMFNDTIAAISQEEAQNKFKLGEAAMILDTTYPIPMYYEGLGEKVGLFNFPEIEDGKGSSSNYLMNFSPGFAISSETENQAAAEAFLAFLFSPERQAAYVELGNIPACSNVKFDESKVNPLMVECMEAFASAEYSIIPWDNPLGTDVGAELNNATQNIITGGDVRESFENLQSYASDAWEQ